MLILFLKAKLRGDDRTGDMFGGSEAPGLTRVKGHVRKDGVFVAEHNRKTLGAKPKRKAAPKAKAVEDPQMGMVLEQGPEKKVGPKKREGGAHKLMAEAQARIAARANFAKDNDGRAFQAPTRGATDGRFVIVTPSAKEPGRWQVTAIDDKGPSGDTQASSYKDAIDVANQYGADFSKVEFAESKKVARDPDVEQTDDPVADLASRPPGPRGVRRMHVSDSVGLESHHPGWPFTYAGLLEYGVEGVERGSGQMVSARVDQDGSRATLVVWPDKPNPLKYFLSKTPTKDSVERQKGFDQAVIDGAKRGLPKRHAEQSSEWVDGYLRAIEQARDVGPDYVAGYREQLLRWKADDAKPAPKATPKPEAKAAEVEKTKDSHADDLRNGKVSLAEYFDARGVGLDGFQVTLSAPGAYDAARADVPYLALIDAMKADADKLKSSRHVRAEIEAIEGHYENPFTTRLMAGKSIPPGLTRKFKDKFEGVAVGDAAKRQFLDAKRKMDVERAIAFVDAKASATMTKSQPIYLFFKANIANRAGMILVPITDRSGRKSARWRKLKIPKATRKDTVTEDMFDPAVSGDLHDPAAVRAMVAAIGKPKAAKAPKRDMGPAPAQGAMDFDGPRVVASVANSAKVSGEAVDAGSGAKAGDGAAMDTERPVIGAGKRAKTHTEYPIGFGDKSLTALVMDDGNLLSVSAPIGLHPKSWPSFDDALEAARSALDAAGLLVPYQGKATAKPKKKAAPTELVAPSGYTITREGSDIWLKGPFSEDLHARIKRAGGRWDGASGTNRKAWVIPAEKDASLKRILSNWGDAGAAKAKDDAARERMSEIKRWLGYVEEKAPDGYLYQKGVDHLRNLGIADHPEMSARLDAAIAQAKTVKAKQDAARKDRIRTDYAEASAPARDQSQPSLRRLYPVRARPQLNTPTQLGSEVVVFTGYGQDFRISEDAPSIHGSHLLGHEGSRGQYAYYRPATQDERDGFARARAMESERAATVAAMRARVKTLSDTFMREGERPDGHHVLDGERLLDTQTIYGGGDWWVIQPDAIWYVRNNGHDGDDWSANNIGTGGAGAIGWKMPRSEEVERQLREAAALSEMRKSDGMLCLVFPAAT